MTVRAFLLALGLALLLTGCDSPERFLVEGNRAYARGDFQGALQAYGRALQSPQTRSTANLNLGRVYLEASDVKNAKAHLDEGLAARPDFALGYVHRARAEVALGDSQAAMQDLRKAVLLDPKLREGWLELGRLLGKLGQPADALEALDKVRPYNAYQAEATFLGLASHRQLGQTEVAAEQLEVLIANQPYLTRSYFELGELRLEQKDYREAERSLKKGLELEPANRAGRLALARSLEGQGDWPRAAREYQALVAGSSQDPPGQKAGEALSRHL